MIRFWGKTWKAAEKCILWNSSDIWFYGFKENPQAGKQSVPAMESIRAFHNVDSEVLLLLTEYFPSFLCNNSAVTCKNVLGNFTAINFLVNGSLIF